MRPYIESIGATVNEMLGDVETSKEWREKHRISGREKLIFRIWTSMLYVAAGGSTFLKSCGGDSRPSSRRSRGANLFLLSCVTSAGRFVFA